MPRSPAPYALAAAVYTLVAVAITWPLVLHPGTLVPSDLGDPLLNIWIMWWNATTLPLTDAWWNAPQFYPFAGSLALSEHLLGLAPITTPVILATGEPLLAYNTAFFLSYPLCALAAHFLVFSITRRHDLSLVAGVAFGFAPYRISHVAHVQVLSAYWMPLSLAGLHRYFDSPAGSPGRTRWLVLFAAAWLLQALACGYYLFFLTVLVVLWLGWFALFRGRARDLAGVAAAWSMAAVVLAPILYGYWQISRAYNLRRTLTEIRLYSADIASVLKAPDMSRVWGWLDVVRRPESDLFPGLAVILLSAFALVIAWRSASRESAGYPRGARVALVLGILATAVSIVRSMHGPFKLEVGGLRLLSVTSPEKPISVAVLCLVIAALLNPSVRAAWRNRSPLAFYALGTAAMWLMSLGPAPTLMNTPAIYKAPYSWLLLLPGADGVRVPARFWMLGTLCLAVTAALAVRRLSDRWPRARRWLPVAAVVAILLESWPQRLGTFPPPQPRPSHSDAAVRLDLPLGEEVDTLALYRAMQHRRPLVNGYSGYFAPHYWALKHLLASRDANVISRLSELGSLEIVVEHHLDQDGTWRDLVQSIPAARIVHIGAGYTSYLLPAREEKTARAAGTPVPFTVSSASSNDRLGPLVYDGDLYTRWHAGREQRRGDSIAVDLGGPATFKGIEILIGGYLADYPRGLLIEVSDDQQTWKPVWSGPAALIAFSGALDSPRDVPLSIPIEPVTARYVRLTQTSFDEKFYWSIAELRILR